MDTPQDSENALEQDRVFNNSSTVCEGGCLIGFYEVAIVVAIFMPRVANAIFALVALVWLVPDPRIDRAMRDPGT